MGGYRRDCQPDSSCLNLTSARQLEELIIAPSPNPDLRASHRQWVIACDSQVILSGPRHPIRRDCPPAFSYRGVVGDLGKGQHDISASAVKLTAARIFAGSSTRSINWKTCPPLKLGTVQKVGNNHDYRQQRSHENHIMGEQEVNINLLCNFFGILPVRTGLLPYWWISGYGRIP